MIMPHIQRMTPHELRRYIKRLNPATPIHKELEHALAEGAGYGSAWYRTQKEHWLGWLREYTGPGAYQRQTGHKRTAEYVYNHIQCAPMLFWLAEALGVEETILRDAFDAVTAANPRNASQCAAFRRMIPWSVIVEKLVERRTFFQRIRLISKEMILRGLK